jgi:hypothetical protein
MECHNSLYLSGWAIDYHICNALSHSKRINNIVIRLVNALASTQLKSILCDESLISGGCAALQWCFARASTN